MSGSTSFPKPSHLQLISNFSWDTAQKPWSQWAPYYPARLRFIVRTPELLLSIADIIEM